MRFLILAIAAVSAVASVAVAQEAVTEPVKAKKITQAEMLDVVCPSKAVMSDKLKAACNDRNQIAKLQLVSTVTIKAPNAELKILYANREFFK